MKDKDVKDIQALCNSLNVKFVETECINTRATREFFEQADADLGLSLGNGYIGKSVFSIPKYGMINVHHEVLPKFQGAMSVMWPIYEDIRETGFTIHQIDQHIDTGYILFQKKFPIKFYPSLKQTIQKNVERLMAQTPEAFSYVCENYIHLRTKAIKQENGKHYTTPTLWQFLRIMKNNKRYYRLN